MLLPPLRSAGKRDLPRGVHASPRSSRGSPGASQKDRKDDRLRDPPREGQRQRRLRVSGARKRGLAGRVLWLLHPVRPGRRRGDTEPLVPQLPGGRTQTRVYRCQGCQGRSARIPRLLPQRRTGTADARLHLAPNGSGHCRGAAIGRANRLLFWTDILHFQQHGLHALDFGGWYPGQSDTRRLGINKFKEGFGGQRASTYMCDRGCTLKGKTALWIRDCLAAWRGRKDE